MLTHSDFLKRNEQFKRRAVIIFWMAMVLSVILSTFLVPYTLNTWLHFMGKEPEVTWWMGTLVGLVPLPAWRLLIIFAAITTWIASLFIM